MIVLSVGGVLGIQFVTAQVFTEDALSEIGVIITHGQIPNHWENYVYADQLNEDNVLEMLGITNGMAYFLLTSGGDERHSWSRVLVSDEIVFDGIDVHHVDGVASMQGDLRMYVIENMQPSIWALSFLIQDQNGIVRFGHGVSSGGTGGFGSSFGDTRIDIVVADRPVKIVVNQMDENNILISSAQYEPKDVPDTYNLDEHAAYVIVETHKESAQGITITRELPDEFFHIFVPREDGILIRRTVFIGE